MHVFSGTIKVGYDHTCTLLGGPWYHVNALFGIMT
jgi:hypothetical protein